MTLTVEPPPTDWRFPDPREADGEVVAVGADLEPGTILLAYRHGLFPMPLQRGDHIGWWSPDPRGIIPLEPGALRVSRSLRKSCRRYEIRVDTAFAEVVDACADPRRPHGWITKAIQQAYGRLHALGWAHSVEAWSMDDGTLAGGLYGLAIGGLFAGESMFHRRTDASKAALVALVELLRSDQCDVLAGGGAAPAGRLLDVQWRTDHLASLGAVEVSRDDYLERLANALHCNLPTAFASNLQNPP